MNSIGSIGIVKTKGITLIEMVVVVVVLSSAIPSLLYMFANITQRSIHAELISTATTLARSTMEEIMSKRYDENALSPYSNPLGPEGGEAYPNFDDVDDFDGFNQATVTGYPGFSRSVVVYYVNPDLAATEPPYHLDVIQPDSSNTLKYKRIDVTVSHVLVGAIKLSVIVASTHKY